MKNTQKPLGMEETSNRRKAVEAVDDSQEITPKKLRATIETVDTAVDDGQEMPPIESVDTNEGSAHSTRTSRGRTHLESLSIHRQHGIKIEVQFDSKGRPIGKEAAQLQSYVGVLAREKVKITYDNWKKVPSNVKEMIWESVNVSSIIYYY